MSQREPDSEPERAGQRARESQSERARESRTATQREPDYGIIFGTPYSKIKFIFILQNGPVLVHATPLLTRALDKYFLNETKSSEWHFFPTYETGFYLPDTSKTIKRLQKEQSRLSFMDK